MRIILIAIGRLKQGPERDLAQRYRERFDAISRQLGFRNLEIHEIAESSARDAPTRMADESAACLKLIPNGAMLVVLDERGQAMPSTEFTGRLERWRDSGTGSIVFVIGGADGLSPELRRKAHQCVAFGLATWPHQLVRIMLLEQIYRAATLLAGHPYHRS